MKIKRQSGLWGRVALGVQILSWRRMKMLSN